MPAAKQGQRGAGPLELFAKGDALTGFDPFKMQLQRPPAALAQAGAQHLALDVGLLTAGEHATCMRRGGKFQMTAANGAVQSLRKHQHAGAAFAGYRSTGFTHAHQHGGLASQLIQGSIDPGHKQFQKRWSRTAAQCHNADKP